MGIKNNVARRIKELCRLRNITINALANLCGLTPSTIYSLLDPQRKDIGIVTIKKICDGLDISLVEFFDTEEFSNCDQEIQ
ncbi:MAG: helix-turn-helix domain-containing protein [Eubacteriales bacterium]